MPRLFIAIDPPPAQRDRIEALCSDLPGARWTPPGQIHLTLRFIGEVDDHLFRQIIAALAEIRTEPLSLCIAGLGHFPPRRSPRVLWLGFKENVGLKRLRNRIETALVSLGVEPEAREFAPHITIARFKNPSLNRFQDYMATHKLFELPAFPVTEFHLYSSKIAAAGATHRREASYPLGV